MLESLLRDHGSDASPREELLRLLGSGSLSAATHQFLSSTLGVCRGPRHVPSFARCLHLWAGKQYCVALGWY